MEIFGLQGVDFNFSWVVVVLPGTIFYSAFHKVVGCCRFLKVEAVVYCEQFFGSIGSLWDFS